MSDGAVVAVVLAGGRGHRAGAGMNKVLVDLVGTPVLVRSTAPFVGHDLIDRVVVVAHTEDLAAVQALLATHFMPDRIDLIVGGAERPDSERRALDLLRAQIDAGEIAAVLIHDGARPLVTRELITQIIEATLRYGGALPGQHADGLLGPDGAAIDAPLVRVQTPQGFRAPELLAAYDRAATDGFAGTDTSSYVERFSDLRVKVVPSAGANLKITWSEDLAQAARLLQS